MSSIKTNKSFQTIVGAFVLYSFWVLYRDGWIDYLLNGKSDEGYGDAQLILALGAMLLNFVQMVGVVTIGVVSGLLPKLEPVFDWLSLQAKAIASQSIKKISSKREDGEWDWKPLAFVILLYLLVSSGKLGQIWDYITERRRLSFDTNPVGVLFSVSDDASFEQRAIASSLQVEESLLSAGVERRMLSSEQQALSDEGWVVEAAEAAPDGVSSMVLVFIDGTTIVEQIPDTVSEVLEVVQ